MYSLAYTGRATAGEASQSFGARHEERHEGKSLEGRQHLDSSRSWQHYGTHALARVLLRTRLEDVARPNGRYAAFSVAPAGSSSSASASPPSITVKARIGAKRARLTARLRLTGAASDANTWLRD